MSATRKTNAAGTDRKAPRATCKGDLLLNKWCTMMWSLNEPDSSGTLGTTAVLSPHCHDYSLYWKGKRSMEERHLQNQPDSWPSASTKVILKRFHKTVAPKGHAKAGVVSNLEVLSLSAGTYYVHSYIYMYIYIYIYICISKDK